MGARVSRRHVLKVLGMTGAGSLVGGSTLLFGEGSEPRVGGRPVQVGVEQVSARTVRFLLRPVERVLAADDGELVRKEWGKPTQVNPGRAQSVRYGELTVQVFPEPLVIEVHSRKRLVQRFRFDEQTGAMAFRLGEGPIFGLGEGGPQFDRRGTVDRMKSGQGGYKLHTHGGRVPIQWLIGTEGWAMFVHQPYGSFDLSGTEGRFTATDAALPLDVFIVASGDPGEIMAEYARLTGWPEMPPRWALGYQQSHRTLASREEVLSVARTFREKKLPCDTLIYLGTGFCPSGWNTENGSFEFNPKVFDNPKAIFDELHALDFHVVLHVVIMARQLRGTVHDPCDPAHYDAEEVGCYWQTHRKDFALGVDGWWPDEGDPLDAASRLTRIRMYYEGPQLDRPNQRPFALHRNGAAGMQRYAPFLWSGDVYSTWETLRTHVPVAINTALSGIPLWGTDTGGFVPTPEFTGELFVRWFQFSAFTPLFRGHGRSWKLRLPWQWDTGELGPNEISGYNGSANPDPRELHNPAVEPICRKYLNLRYRLLPYTYTAVRESHDTGLPVIRALWLHYPDDPAAVGRGDEYLWGRNLLVAPVTEKDATTRSLYLPRGDWYDFWTEEKIAGGREVVRPVDLATLPLYARSGAILPLNPVQQYTAEAVDGPLTITIYPGSDGEASLYEDDGATFNYRHGEFMRVVMRWNERKRQLSLSLAPGSRLLPPQRRKLEVRLAGTKGVRRAVFEGRALSILF